MKVRASVIETLLIGDHGDVDGVEATCTRCGSSEESYGTSEASVKRCLVLLRQNCGRSENNFYVGG